MTEFSGAWYLSIVSQAAKATYIRTQSTQYNFVSLRIVEGSAGAVVATSQIKAVELACVASVPVRLGNPDI